LLLIYLHSDQHHTGFLNTRNSNLAFLTSNETIFPQSSIQELISELTASLESTNNELTPLQRAQFDIQLAWLKDGSVPQGEFIGQSNGLVNPANDTKYLSIISGLMHPLSRGTIASVATPIAAKVTDHETRNMQHINTTDPLAHPVIDPKYLSFDYGTPAWIPMQRFNLTNFVQIFYRFVCLLIPAFKYPNINLSQIYWLSKSFPRLSLMRQNWISEKILFLLPTKAYDAFHSFVISSFIVSYWPCLTRSLNQLSLQTGDHLAGTAAMASRDLGGECVIPSPPQSDQFTHQSHN
jgi:hypothetical protein